MFLPPDTTTLAPVSSGRSLLLRFCSTHSESPAGEGEATALKKKTTTSQKINQKHHQKQISVTTLTLALLNEMYTNKFPFLPSSDTALPPSTAAASKDVPRTVKTLTDSLHFTVLRALPGTQHRPTNSSQDMPRHWQAFLFTFHTPVHRGTPGYQTHRITWSRPKTAGLTGVDGPDEGVRGLDLNDVRDGGHV